MQEIEVKLEESRDKNEQNLWMEHRQFALFILCHGVVKTNPFVLNKLILIHQHDIINAFCFLLRAEEQIELRVIHGKHAERRAHSHEANKSVNCGRDFLLLTKLDEICFQFLIIVFAKLAALACCMYTVILDEQDVCFFEQLTQSSHSFREV